MQYVKIVKSKPVAYSLAQLRADNPNTSFAQTIPEAELNRWGIYLVDEDPKPLLSANQVLDVLPVKKVAGRWVQSYGAINIPATVQQIKAEAERRILLIAPLSKQANMQRAGLEVLQALVLNGSLTPAQQAVSDALNAVSVQIDAIRAASNKLEALTPIPLDFTNDTHWI